MPRACRCSVLRPIRQETQGQQARGGGVLRVAGPCRQQVLSWHLLKSFSINPGSERGHPKPPTTEKKSPCRRAACSRGPARPHHRAPATSEMSGGGDFRTDVLFLRRRGLCTPTWAGWAAGAPRTQGSPCCGPQPGAGFYALRLCRQPQPSLGGGWASPSLCTLCVASKFPTIGMYCLFD